MRGFDAPGLGRLPSPDPRDRAFLMAAFAAPAGPAPTARHYRTGPVLDQGPFPHCVGYAWRQFLSSAPLMTTGGPRATAIYAEAQTRDEWEGVNYAGTSVRAGAKYLHEIGHVSMYLWAWDVTAVREWLLAGGGTVVLGTNWYEGMMATERDGHRAGFVAVTGRSLGGHAYLCVGYSAARRSFRAVNSWGVGWGERGRFWIREEDLARLLAEDGEACTAIERKATP